MLHLLENLYLTHYVFSFELIFFAAVKRKKNFKLLCVEKYKTVKIKNLKATFRN